MQSFWPPSHLEHDALLTCMGLFAYTVVYYYYENDKQQSHFVAFIPGESCWSQDHQVCAGHLKKLLTDLNQIWPLRKN